MDVRREADTVTHTWFVAHEAQARIYYVTHCNRHSYSCTFSTDLM